MKTVRPVGPYARAALGYWEEGWTPLPLPENEKWPPPLDWTGGNKPHSGEHPAEETVRLWIGENGSGNICIRMPKNVLGIDADMYEGKEGRETLNAASEAWGALPATWMSTSRDDGSGIRLFRIPEGLAWPGKLPQGGGVELIRWDHRYAIVAPSTNPINAGAEYHWIDPEGLSTSDEDGWEFPAIADLPELPEAWVTGLTNGKKWEPRPEADMDSAEVKTWLEGRTALGDKLCGAMHRTLNKWLEQIRRSGPEGGAHDATRDAVWALIGDAGAGHVGLKPALTRVRAAFGEAVKGRRSRAEISKEWRGFIEGGVRKVAAEGEPEDEDYCQQVETSRVAKVSKRVGSAAHDYSRDDLGNARRFVRRYRDSVRYVEALGGWHVWDESRWALDLTGEVTRMAAETVASMEDEAAYIEDLKEQAAFRKFIRASSNIGKLRAMLDLARDLKGMTVHSAAFDSNSRLLVCSNGTIELGEPTDVGGTVRYRPSRQEDYNTATTGTRYVAGARSDLWDKFLARFQPDEEIRAWLQRLVGYSLLGYNPKRLMVVAYGPTSSGKSTFADVVARSLGGYASATSMSVFRDNQDERPRADLVRALTRRFVYAEEASHSWHMHPDQIKRITGGTPITARLPYAKEYVERTPAFTPWLLTNAAPTIEGADLALWRRLIVVPFMHTISADEEDAGFHRRLLGETEAVLAWAVEGYHAWASDPDASLEIPASSLEINRKFRAELSDFDTCLEDIAEMGPLGEGFWEKPSRLYEAYERWCDDNGVAARDRLSGTGFGRALNGRGHHKTSTKRYPGREGKPVEVRAGLRLRESWARVVTPG